MEEKTRNCGSWGRSPRQEGGGTQEEIAKDVGQDCRNQKEKVRQATIQQEASQGGKEGIDKAWAHVDQAHCAGGELKSEGEVGF